MFNDVRHVPRFDSQLSSHQDVANFLSCVRLQILNPTLQMDTHQLSKCVGFAHLFPHVEGITQPIWGAPIGVTATHSQQGILLWMQALQERIDAATAANLDKAATAFGPCEEQRLRRGVSGRSDVEGVRQDLEFWIKQHEELSKRLRNQRQYIRQLLNETRSVSGSTVGGNNTNNNSPVGIAGSVAGNSVNGRGSTSAHPFDDDDDALYFYQQRQLERQQLENDRQKNKRSPHAAWDNTVDKLYGSRKPVWRDDDECVAPGGTAGLNASRRASFYQLQHQQSLPTHLSAGLADNLVPPPHSARSDASDVSRSTSGNTTAHVAESLGHELLALQSMRLRVEGVAKTRESLVKALVSLGSPPKKMVRTATNPGY